MTRVLLDARMTAGGAGRYAKELPRALASVPGSPELLVASRQTGPLGVLDLPFTSWGRNRVATRAVESKANLVHGLHFELPEKWKGPSVVTFQDLIPLDFPASMRNPLRRKAFMRIIDAALERAGRIIVPSQLTADSVMRYGARMGQIRVIPLWVSSQFSPLTETEEEQARKRFGLGSAYVAAIFHPKPHKNFLILRNVASELAKTNKVRLVAAGVHQVDGVESAGRLTDADLRIFLGGSEVFLLPSLLEGFGLPALEALACGTPVVCGAGVGALPLMREAVVVVDVSDAREMARVVGSLVADDNARRSMGRLGRRTAEGLHIEATAAATVDVYRELL